MKSVTAAGLLATLALVNAPAKADVIYSITQTSPTFGNPASGQFYHPTVDITTNLLVIVTDEAAAQGFNVGYGGVPPFGGSGTASPGLVDVVLQVFHRGGLRLDWNLADMLAAPGRIGTPEARFGVTATAEGLLSGGLYANDLENSITYSLNGTSAVSGTIGSDAFGACGFGVCTFTATQTRIAAPEPMSIALFGVGLAGLAAVRRRKA